MVKTHIRILGIAPYESMHTAMEQAARAYPDVEIDVYTGDLEDAQIIVERMPPHTYDCIISRGGTTSFIRKVTGLPVVDINVSVYDVLRSMKLAENYSNRYAIVGFPSITGTAHILCDLLGYHLDILTVHSAEDASRTLERLKRDGYGMVVCDAVTHTTARQMGLEAFLITSGIESLQAAIDQAIRISAWFRRLRQENIFLRSIAQGQNARVAVLNPDGHLYYSSPSEPSADLQKTLRSHLREIPANGTFKFYHTERDQLYSITGQQVFWDGVQRSLFYCLHSRIPLHTGRTGIRTMNRGECEYLFAGSFFSLSGAMGSIGNEIRALARGRSAVMICGEPGTGKEQIARFLYLNSPLSNQPFVVVSCTKINDKDWDFLLDHYSSPLNAVGNTVYFKNFETVSPAIASRLASTIEETGLSHRIRLLFSCVSYENEAMPEVMRIIGERLGYLTLPLPSLRSRSDEIPSLASLYLNALSIELGKQFSGFEPRALDLLRQYPWPNNYTQFKNLLHSLAILSEGSYIRTNTVAELLSKERLLRNAGPSAFLEIQTDQTLEDIISDAVQRTVAAHGGNRTAAARQLGISRSTLWRYLGRFGEENAGTKEEH